MKNSHLSTEKAKFARTWLHIWIHLRSHCEKEWEYFRLEHEKLQEKRRRPAQVDESTPPGVVAWRNAFRKCHGRIMPAVVCAAGAFRRDFVRLVSAVFPELGLEQPRTIDPTEKAMADNPNWEDALQVALSYVEDVKTRIISRLPKSGITDDTPLHRILDHLQKAYEGQLTALVQQEIAADHNIVPPPLSVTSYITIPSGPANTAILKFLSPEHLQTISGMGVELLHTQTISWRAPISSVDRHPKDKAQMVGLIGFESSPEKYVLNLLKENGILAVKAHYVLWARWAREFGDAVVPPGRSLTLTLSQFCDDLGFIKHKGSYRPENRKAALDVIEFLTGMAFVCRHQPPRGTAEIVRGPSGYEDGWPNIFAPRASKTYYTLKLRSKILC